jgi:GTPase SAR1 family protein/DNA-binding MarR family transcriptional regulator
MGEMWGSPRVSVDNDDTIVSDTMTPRHHDDRSTGKPLAWTMVVGKDGRKVVVSVYNAGEVEKVEGDKVVRRTKLRFVLKYKDVVKECISTSSDLNVDCGLAIKEVAKATHYSVPYKALREAISELRDKHANEEAVSIVDYVRQKYPDKLAEIERDPFKWVLDRTKEIVGYERLKLLTFLSIVSSQMDRVMGMSRIHLMLVGPSGAGKSSTVKSVVRFIDDSDIYIPGTRLTQNALGYLDVKTVDGKVLFIEQIDRQAVNYLREMMTEEKITTLVTEKVVDEEGRERFVTRRVTIPGQATVITTSVVDTIDVDREQLFNRFLKVYVNPKSVDIDKVIEAIWTRKKSELSEVDKLVFLAYLLSRPKFADNRDLLERAKRFLKPIAGISREPINRTAEILRNLAIAVAIARGKTKVDDEDFDFVMRNFQLDILYNGLGLSERDVDFILALPDHGGVKTNEVVDELKENKQYVLNVLKNLERKGVVEGVKEDGKTFTWFLTPLGKRIKALVNGIEKDVVEVEDEKGETVAMLDPKFRPDDEREGNRGNAVPVNDGGGVSGGEKEADRGAQKIDPELMEFMKYVDKNDGAEKTFGEIVADFGDKTRASKFLSWCINTGRCEKVTIYEGQTTIDQFVFRAKEEDIFVATYTRMKGHKVPIKEMFDILGDELASEFLKWAEPKGLVRRTVIDGEDYIEFV